MLGVGGWETDIDYTDNKGKKGGWGWEGGWRDGQAVRDGRRHRGRETATERGMGQTDSKRERERELSNHFTLIKESDRRVNVSLLHTVKNKVTSSKIGRERERATPNNNNNVHLSCAHQRPERSHDTY